MKLRTELRTGPRTGLAIVAAFAVATNVARPDTGSVGGRIL